MKTVFVFVTVAIMQDRLSPVIHATSAGGAERERSPRAPLADGLQNPIVCFSVLLCVLLRYSY